jgi:hypothetical protein
MQKECAFVLSLLVVALTLPCQAKPASEQEKNKTVARTFFEEVLGHGGNLERYADFHTADYVGHMCDSRPDFYLAEDLAAARDMRKAMPDMQNVVNHMVPREIWSWCIGRCRARTLGRDGGDFRGSANRSRFQE